jgi:hypothetical protein
MKRIAIPLFLLAIVPWQAKALNTYDNNDVLSYVAMPLAVSAVCDVRGVQTDRVGELVGYMDQANVAPADFIDVFRYVPVALVMRTDRQPDFVEWVHTEVDQGVAGPELVTLMERRLRTYDRYVPVSSYNRHRRYRSDAYASNPYYYESGYYENDYVPVVIRRHCDRLILDPLALIEMPVAVANVCDLRGMPYERVSSLVVELNLGDVPPVQFVEMLRYAPAALVVDGGYYGQPDFVQFVRTERINGISGYGLVSVIDQRLPAYGITAQIDLGSPVYVGRNYYAPTIVNYVPPIDPVYIPPPVQTFVAQTRVAGGFAQGGASFVQPAPAVAAAPQVQRLLNTPNAGAVVVSPGQARRELGQGRMHREAPMVTAPVGAPAPGAQTWGGARGRGQEVMGGQPAPAIAGVPGRGNGHGRGRELNTPVAVGAPAPVMASPGRGHGRNRAESAPAVAPPAGVMPGPGRGRGNGRGGSEGMAPPTVAPSPALEAPRRGNGRGRGEMNAPAMVAPSAPVAPSPGRGRGNGRGRQEVAAPVIVAPPAAAVAAPNQEQHGYGRGRRAEAAPAPVVVAPPAPAAVVRGEGRGRGGAPPAAVVAPPAPAAAAPAPAQGPPGQQKKKGREKDQ